MSKLNINRRGFLGGALAATAAMSLPRSAKAAAAPHQRKFLFFFAGGGWDTTTVLDPHYENGSVVDMDLDTMPATLGNLTWTSGVGRENVDQFFARWGGRSAIVNGVDVHSVGHDSARQFVMTGTSASSYSDWPTTLAANSPIEYPLPHLVFSGPAYPGTNGSAVVRAGGGTLLSLIGGTINGQADQPAPEISPPVNDILDDFVYKRVADYASQHKGNARLRAEALVQNMERATELEGREFEAGLSNLGSDTLEQAISAVSLFRLGLARCAMIGIPGGWDSHGNNLVQGPQQDEFYRVLNELFDYMSRTPGENATWLIDEVVVVATSEIGRTPALNPTGKDHWPYGSYMIAGAGVHGNRVLGRTDPGLQGLNINFGTGQEDSNGDRLGCENVGTALLELGGLDPEAYLPGIQPLSGLVRGS